MRLQRKQSLESNLKRSIANKGKKRSEETKQKISNGLKKHWASLPYSLGDKNKEENTINRDGE